MSDSKELTVPERAAVALGAYEGEKALVVLATKYADIIEIKNPAGRTQCHAAAMELSNARIAVDKTGKAAREDANAFQKAVIAEAARRIAIIKPEEDRLLALRDVWDAEREAEKAAKAEAERKRVQGIRNRIEGFMLNAVTASSGSAEAIREHTTRLSETVIAESEFGEFTEEAKSKRADTVKWLRERQQQATEREAEARRLAEERAQLERERREAAERERQVLEARALDEGLAREAREREAARLRAEQERAAAELRAQQEAHAKLVREQQAEIARQQAEIDAERQRQADEAARIEREKQEAIAAEAERVAAEEQRKREEVELAARQEAERKAAEQRAAEAKRLERERAQFELNGPGADEIVAAVAEQWGVTNEVALAWMNLHTWAEVEVTA